MALARGASGKGEAGIVHDVGVSPDFKEYSSFAADVMADCVAGAPRPCRGFLISDVGSGTKIVECVTLAGQTRSITAANLQGIFLPGGVRSFTANTTVARVIVFW